jgi:hypothetical protein
VQGDATPNDPLWSGAWGQSRSTRPRPGTARQQRLDRRGGPRLRVDQAHPDLQNAFVPGRDIVNGDDDPADDHGHGTKSAGVVAARSNNAVGVASYCWSCSVMPVKVIAADGTGTMSAQASGITWAATAASASSP